MKILVRKICSKIIQIDKLLNNLKILGVSHADDTAYALKNEYINVLESESDKSMVSFMVDIWASFVFTG